MKILGIEPHRAGLVEHEHFPEVPRGRRTIEQDHIAYHRIEPVELRQGQTVDDALQR